MKMKLMQGDTWLSDIPNININMQIKYHLYGEPMLYGKGVTDLITKSWHC